MSRLVKPRVPHEGCIIGMLSKRNLHPVDLTTSLVSSTNKRAINWFEVGYSVLPGCVGQSRTKSLKLALVPMSGV